MDRRVDWISILPDPLLHHILSFLDTKCAIRTSILSKRWKYIWTSIPNFNFLNWRSADYYLDVESDNKKFVNFMDRMIHLRDMSHMRRFYLKCDESSNGFRINSWISAVISRKVEELILILEADELDEIPPSLFTCGSLVSLELQLPYLYLCLPNCISFPRLKVLRLFGINFRDELLTEQLFSSCPILEDFIMRDCTWLYVESLCISAPALKRLEIDNSFLKDVDYEDGLDNCMVKIRAPSLVSLVYKGSVAKEYDLSSFPLLVDAEIDLVSETLTELWDAKISYSAGVRVNEFLRGLTNVNCLTISGQAIKGLSFADDLLKDLAPFCNLIQLDVTGVLETSADTGICALLQLAPRLESLIFREGLPMDRAMKMKVGR